MLYQTLLGAPLDEPSTSKQRSAEHPRLATGTAGPRAPAVDHPATLARPHDNCLAQLLGHVRSHAADSRA